MVQRLMDGKVEICWFEAICRETSRLNGHPLIYLVHLDGALNTCELEREKSCEKVKQCLFTILIKFTSIISKGNYKSMSEVFYIWAK